MCTVYFDLSLYFLVFGAALVGISGNIIALLSASFSYVSDISSKKWRTVRIAIVESMLILPGLISSETSGIWFRDIGCKLGPPLLLYMACHVVIILYTLLYLPESLGKENRKKKFGLEFLLRGFKILLCGVKEYKSSMWKVWAAFLPMIVQATVSISSTSVTILFLKTLDWDSDLIGAYFAALLGSAWLAIVVVLPILVVLKFPDFLISLIGVLFGFLTNSFLGFARETYQLFIRKSIYLKVVFLFCFSFHIVYWCI